MNFTRWSARLPGTQRRAAARTDHAGSSAPRVDSVPAARAEQLTDDEPTGLMVENFGGLKHRQNG